MSGAYWGRKFDFDGWAIPDNFFEKISEIAYWIGNELESQGVYVSQAKEKFGQARVYVVLEPEDYDIYRGVYFAAIRRWPAYVKYILEGADYDYLLGPILGEPEFLLLK